MSYLHHQTSPAPARTAPTRFVETELHATAPRPMASKRGRWASTPTVSRRHGGSALLGLARDQNPDKDGDSDSDGDTVIDNDNASDTDTDNTRGRRVPPSHPVASHFQTWRRSDQRCQLMSLPTCNPSRPARHSTTDTDAADPLGPRRSAHEADLYQKSSRRGGNVEEQPARESEAGTPAWPQYALPRSRGPVGYLLGVRC
ncbi:hypothetical protein B2J93_3463 [Marssonina coronariae]|uniref:Uncharacterized protein n=1 Tax=Diplocarpon coronariae TaxID=2795749 RepID=A0A218Z5U5_9HELO|nr:hypothetical protein B2J93_3463 [Marssonina coronariae]